MSSTRQLLTKHTVSDLLLIAYCVVDDYLKESLAAGRFTLPDNPQQKASYAELMAINIVGEFLSESHAGMWFLLVKEMYSDLFPTLPDVTRYHRVIRNLETVWADFGLCLANVNEKGMEYMIDSKPLPICKPKRRSHPREMAEATLGYGTQGPVYGFKLHLVTNSRQMVCRYAIVPANEHDITVAKCLLDPSYDNFEELLGDKGYIGLGIKTPSKKNAKKKNVWTKHMDSARKLIETVLSSLTRTNNLVATQLNSFWSVRAAVCRKIAAHNLAIWLGF
jgi:hypothetical protein